MRSNMPFQPEWLVEVAPHYYNKEEVDKLGVDKKMPKGEGMAGAGTVQSKI